MPNRAGLNPWVIVGVLAAVLIGADQWTKYLAETHLSGHRVFEIIPGFFDFSLVYNSGAAFGFGRGWSELWRKVFFLGVSCFAVLLMAHLLYRLRNDGWLPRLALTLILSGAIGNLIDRFRYGHVVDFVHVYYQRYHWPNFNIADSCICVGIGLFAIYLLKSDNRSK